MRKELKLYGAAAILLMLALWFARTGQGIGDSTKTSEASKSDPLESLSRERTASHPDRARATSASRFFDFATIAKMWNKGSFPKLTPQEIEDYVMTQDRSAESLLAAFMLGEEQAYLDEALERFPDNPHVLLVSLRGCVDPEKRLELLEALKTAEPENGLFGCLAARALFDLGRNDEALAELRSSLGKDYSDYTTAACSSLEAAYASIGFSPAKAKLISIYSVSKPELMQLGAPLINKLVELRRDLATSGDPAAAESLRNVQIAIGRQLENSGMLVDIIVGIRYERQAFSDVNTAEGMTRLQELESQKHALNNAAKRVASLMEDPKISESDWVQYFDLVTATGEIAANEWMLGKYPDP